MQTAKVNASEMLKRHAIRKSLCQQKFMLAKVNHGKDKVYVLKVYIFTIVFNFMRGICKCPGYCLRGESGYSSITHFEDNPRQ